MISDGCRIASGARVERSILSPGVKVASGVVVRESVVLTDVMIESNAVVERAILDKRCLIGEGAHVGRIVQGKEVRVPMVGKHAQVPPGMRVEPGAVIGPDVIAEDYLDPKVVRDNDFVGTKRLPYEV
jgi:glucose-1-phosphate adenylyltransferase